MKCDNCTNPATVHLTEIRAGKKIEKHLCEKCAAATEGIPAKSHTPINELLTNFVMAHSSMPKEPTTGCEHCGMTWAEFRQGGLLGCEHDYILFDKDLTPLLQRAHESATHHVGKVPARRGPNGQGPAPSAAGPEAAAPARQAVAAKLKKELQRAIEAEDYERAAQIRDAIRKAEGPTPNSPEDKK